MSNEKNVRLTPATLGKYLGAECEYESYEPNGMEWHHHKGHIEPRMIQNQRFRNIGLILRPLESMTEDERKAIVLRIEEYCGGMTDEEMGSYVQTCSTDIARSEGFDCGGEIEVVKELHLGKETISDYMQYNPGPTTTEVIWVPSLIAAKVAIEKEFTP